MRFILSLSISLLLCSSQLYAQPTFSLDGDWLISPLQTANKPYSLKSQKKLGYFKSKTDTQNWRTITLPLAHGWSAWDKSVSPDNTNKSYWASQHKNVTHNAVWYRRNFNTPTLASGQRLILHFDAIAWESAIWVNGKHITDHRGSFTPINVDITDHLNANQTNTLSVCALSDYGARPIRHVYGKMFFANQNMAGIIGSTYITAVKQTRVDHTRITPDLDRRSIAIQYNIQHAAQTSITVKVLAKIQEHGDSQKRILATKDLGRIRLKFGNNLANRSIAFPEFIAWTPDTPKLYDLIFEIQQNGKTLSNTTHRFGMRQFIAKGNRFYLNGVHTRLYIGNIKTYNLLPQDQPQKINAFKNWLTRQKKVGVNTIRYHMGGINSNHILKAADEVGMLVINEWAWFHRVEYGLTKPDQLAEFYANNDAEMAAWVKRDYNHPSCIAWSLANEVWTKKEIPMLNHTYEQMRKLDPSGRPMTNSSGYHSVIRKNKGQTDIYDFHNYSMHSRYAWPVVHESIDADKQVLENLYGKIDKPIIITESLAIWRPTAVKLKNFTPQQYVEHKNTRYVRELGLANLQNRNTAYKQITEQWSIPILEAFRQETLIQGFGPWYDNRNQLPQQIARVYGPYYVGFNVRNWPNAHHYAGQTWHADMVVINDPLQAIQGTLQLTVRKKHQPSEPVFTFKQSITFKAGQEKINTKIQWNVPANLQAGDYDVDVELHDSKKNVLANNQMTLRIAWPLTAQKIKSDVKIGIWSTPKNDAVIKAIKHMKLPYTLTQNINELDQFNVLILADGWGESIDTLAGKLNHWVNNGGRLLAFTPGKSVPLPWALGMEIESGNNMRQPFVDWVVREHPVLLGLHPKDFSDGFNGPKRLSVNSMIKPMTANTILAAGSYSSNGQMAVLDEAKIGQGAYMTCTLNFSNRFATDPIATKLLLNMLKYVIQSNILKHAPMMQQIDIHPVRKTLSTIPLADWQTVALFDVANAPLKNTLGDGSTLDFQHLPQGRQILGNVPFALASTSSQKQHAILAMQGHRLPNLPQRIDGIVINAKAKRLAWLAAAYYSARGQIATYIVHYADGSQIKIPVHGGEQVGDMFGPKDQSDAIVAWEKPHPVITHATVGAYLHLWENPKPNLKIKTVDIISQGAEQTVGSTLMLLGLSVQCSGK